MRQSLNPRLRWVERLSYLMDDQFRVPGTKFRFGLDPIFSLIPFAGDLGGSIVSAAMVIAMARHGVSGKVLVLMTLNIILDTTIGAIPVVGTVFDFFFKSNSRNIRLLNEHYQEGKHQGSGRGLIIAILIILIVFFLLFLYLLWLLFNWAASLI